MLTRLFAVSLATVLAGLPLAARADFWLNAYGTKGLPSVYASSGCREVGVNGNARLSTAKCPRGGNIQIRQHYSNPHSSACALRVWETGLLKFTWHAEFTKNENTVCSMKWVGENTVELQIIN